jgi:hypothetical protein
MTPPPRDALFAWRALSNSRTRHATFPAPRASKKSPLQVWRQRVVQRGRRWALDAAETLTVWRDDSAARGVTLLRRLRGAEHPKREGPQHEAGWPNPTLGVTAHVPEEPWTSRGTPSQVSLDGLPDQDWPPRRSHNRSRSCRCSAVQRRSFSRATWRTLRVWTVSWWPSGTTFDEDCF